VCDSPSLFILSVLCVVVSISGRLYFCIFSCDPPLFLSGVLCPSPQAIGALLFLHAVWWDGQKLIRFLYSGGHMMEYCLLCCVFSGAVVYSLVLLCCLWCCCAVSGAVVLSLVLLCCLWCCVVLSLLSALEMFEVPGHRGDTPPGGLHFCRKGVWRVGRDVFNSHDTGKI